MQKSYQPRLKPHSQSPSADIVKFHNSCKFYSSFKKFYSFIISKVQLLTSKVQLLIKKVPTPPLKSFTPHLKSSTPHLKSSPHHLNSSTSHLESSTPHLKSSTFISKVLCLIRSSISLLLWCGSFVYYSRISSQLNGTEASFAEWCSCKPR